MNIPSYNKFVDLNTPLGKLLMCLSGKFKFPYLSIEKENYKESIKTNIEMFIQTIEEYQEHDEFIDNLKNSIRGYQEIKEKLISTIDFYLKGDAYQAYENLNQAITNNPILSKHWPKLQLDIPDNYYFYRVRETDDQISSIEEMFHVPFDKIYKVKTQRYSIAGVPCLYLGESIFSCWLEMNRPDLNKLYVSCFSPQNNNKLKVLDLTSSFNIFISNSRLDKFIIDEEDEFNDYFKAIISMWPITHACSYRRKYKNADFNIEHIIPNLLLQWVKKNKTVNGIRYLSTYYDFRYPSNIGYTYVFPTRENEGKYCQELCRNFKLSPPVAWQILNAMTRKYVLSEPTTDGGHTDSFEDELIKDYKNTTFGFIERFFKGYPKRMKQISTN